MSKTPTAEGTVTHAGETIDPIVLAVAYDPFATHVMDHIQRGTETEIPSEVNVIREIIDHAMEKYEAPRETVEDGIILRARMNRRSLTRGQA